MRNTCILFLILFLLFSCAKQEEKLIGDQGGTMIIGTMDIPATISPLNPSMFGSNDILDLLFLHMHRIDPATGRMNPELASSWEFSEDLTSITYYLRQDVVWWDGTPVTAEDVYYTYQKMKDPETQYPNIARLRFIEDVEVLNNYAIKFTFDRVYADLLTDSDIMPVPKHIYETAGEDFGSETLVGNGPYKVKERTPGSGLILTANEDYYRGKPPLDEIVLKYYSDMDMMMEDLANGDVDMVLNITPTRAMEVQDNQNIAIDSRPGNTYTYIGWNLNHPFLKDQEIRKALSMAINTENLLNTVFEGMGKISCGPLPPSSWGYNDSIELIPYDLSEARSILEKKGFEDRNRNRILDKDRNDFVLKIITNVENPERVRILDLVAEDLSDLGVRVNTVVLDTRSFITALVNRNFDGFIMGWSVEDKIDPAVYWNSNPEKGVFNFVSYKNEKVDSLMEIGVSMLNRKKAEEIWREFQKLVYEDQPYTFLIVSNNISAVHKRVKGVENGVTLAAAYSYYIPEAERRVAVASLPPAPEETTTTVVAKPPEEEVAEERKPPVEEEKPPSVVAPEKLLEAAVKKETTAVAVTKPETTATAPIVPPEPPKPSVITKAQVVKRILPKYPESARAIGATGRVTVKVTIGVDGNVKSATIAKSFGNPACEAAALEAAKKWQFTPATKDGVPFEQHMHIPFDFKPQ
jgi:peptide/nickel transport system substrate-binding protein